MWEDNLWWKTQNKRDSEKWWCPHDPGQLLGQDLKWLACSHTWKASVLQDDLHDAHCCAWAAASLWSGGEGPVDIMRWSLHKRACFLQHLTLTQRGHSQWANPIRSSLCQKKISGVGEQSTWGDSPLLAVKWMGEMTGSSRWPQVAESDPWPLNTAN
jgi:hypothetical protein